MYIIQLEEGIYLRAFRDFDEDAPSTQEIKHAEMHLFHSRAVGRLAAIRKLYPNLVFENANIMWYDGDSGELSDTNVNAVKITWQERELISYFMNRTYEELELDFNTLMVIVEKIEEIDDSCYWVNINGMQCDISMAVNHNIPEDNFKIANFNSENSKSKLESVCKAVLEFINWHNRSKQS